MTENRKAPVGRTAGRKPASAANAACNVSPSILGLLVPLADLRPDPRNARRHDERNVAAIAKSLERFGQQKPIVVGPDGAVVAGSGQLEAALRLGWTHLAAVRTDLEGPERTAYALADNRTAELAEWDTEVLASLVAELQAQDAEVLAAVGFGDDLAAILGPAGPAIPEQKFMARPPAWTWVLIGIPTARYHEVNDQIEACSSAPGATVKVSVTSGND